MAFYESMTPEDREYLEDLLKRQASVATVARAFRISIINAAEAVAAVKAQWGDASVSDQVSATQLLKQKEAIATEAMEAWKRSKKPRISKATRKRVVREPDVNGKPVERSEIVINEIEVPSSGNASFLRVALQAVQGVERSSGLDAPKKRDQQPRVSIGNVNVYQISDAERRTKADEFLRLVESPPQIGSSSDDSADDMVIEAEDDE